MPELPEVETIKRELKKAVLGKKILAVLVHNPKVIRQPKQEEFVHGLKNTTVKKILRKGKMLIFALSNDKFLTVHLKMTGQLIYPGNCKKSRVSFRLSDGKWLDFNDSRIFGELKLVDDWQQLAFIKNLGPEPFDLSVEQFQAILSRWTTKIKPLLMDQTFICGIGNLYAAEALFRAKIDPRRSAASLSTKEKQLLFQEIKKTLNEAIHYGGSSVDQYVRVSGKPGSYAQHHRVYDREGKPCLICKTPIKRISLGGRGTYFCPRCQK